VKLPIYACAPPGVLKRVVAPAIGRETGREGLRLRGSDNMKTIGIGAVMIGALALAGCHSGGNGAAEGQSGGPGVAAQKEPAGPPVGLILGGLANSEPAESLNDADKAFMTQQTNQTLESAPTNQASSWRNPDGGAQATVTPTRTYQQANGTYCRDYSQSIVLGSRSQTANGTACRRSDGTWQVVS
jgi:surface antigen